MHICKLYKRLLATKLAVRGIIAIEHCGFVAFQIYTFAIIVDLKDEDVKIVVFVVVGDAYCDGLIKCSLLLTHKVCLIKVLKY